MAALEAAGFTGSVNTREVDSLEDEGSVATVSPEVGQPAAPDATITLGISTGTIDLPDVAGRSEAEARAILTDAGFSDVQISTEEVDSTEPPGTVVGTTPGAASPASAGTRIVLQISGGVGEIVVPNVRGGPRTTRRPLSGAPASPMCNASRRRTTGRWTKERCSTPTRSPGTVQRRCADHVADRRAAPA